MVGIWSISISPIKFEVVVELVVYEFPEKWGIYVVGSVDGAVTGG